MAPADALAAYSVPASTGAYGKIVAIVDMPDSHVYQDLSTYRAQYKLPALPQCASGFPDGKTPCFAQVDELGRTPNVTATNCAGTSGETALDVEMVSAVCPDCSIVLVQLTLADMTYGPGDGDFLQAAQTAATLGAIATSISYGGPEVAGHDNTGYTTPGHLVFASSGDESYLDVQFGTGVTPSPQFPASSPDVVGVGGTTLVPLGGTTYAEKVWNDTQYPQGQGTTSGCSTEFPAPAFQTAFLATHPGAFGACTNRDSVDVSAAAEFASSTGDGISIYDSGEGGWVSELGTSAASPMVAGMFTRLGVAEAVSNDSGLSVHEHRRVQQSGRQQQPRRHPGVHRSGPVLGRRRDELERTHRRGHTERGEARSAGNPEHADGKQLRGRRGWRRGQRRRRRLGQRLRGRGRFGLGP